MIIPHSNFWEWPDYFPKLQLSHPAPKMRKGSSSCFLPSAWFGVWLWSGLAFQHNYIQRSGCGKFQSKRGASALIKKLWGFSSGWEHIFSPTMIGFSDRDLSWTKRAAYTRRLIFSLQNCNKCLFFINHPAGRNQANKDVTVLLSSQNQHGSPLLSLWQLQSTVTAASRPQDAPGLWAPWCFVPLATPRGSENTRLRQPLFLLIFELMIHRVGDVCSYCSDICILLPPEKHARSPVTLYSVTLNCAHPTACLCLCWTHYHARTCCRKQNHLLLYDCLSEAA